MMKKFTHKRMVSFILLMVLIFSGCGRQVVKLPLKSEFDQKLDRVILEIIAGCRARISQTVPAAVVSQAALEGKQYSRLDEIIVQRLENRLSRDREMVNLSRENWFELRESRPLSLKGHPSAHGDLLDGFIVFIVDVEPDEVFEEIKVSITAKDGESRKLAGVNGQAILKYGEDSPGTLLLKASAKSSPFPPGLKENPYGSMERLCYSLASDLSSALKRGVDSGRYSAFGDEIQVVLCSGGFNSTDPQFKNAFMQVLQQALAAMDGMTCAVSREDAGPVFQQMDFYKTNHHLFENENEKFKPGSVLLMAQTRSFPHTNMKHAALRAVWRVSPLTDKDGGFVPENMSGTYVSGFTSRAWFDGEISVVFEKKPHKAQNEEIWKKNVPDKGFD